MINIARHQSLKFIVPAAVWFFIVGLIRYLHRPFGLDFDGAEQTYLSQWFEMGSGIQPPLPTWIFHVVFDLFGHSVAWVHVVRLFLIFLIYVGFYKLSLRLIKSPVLALITTLSLVFIFQFSSVMLKQMHTVFITLAVIYSWLCIVNIYEKGNLKSFLWLGFWLGIGFLSKYNFFIHVGALLLAIVSMPDIRKQVFRPRIILTIILAVIFCSPHYIWLLENLGTVSNNVNTDLTDNPDASIIGDYFQGYSELLIKSFAFGGVLVLVFFGFFFTTFKTNLKRNEPMIFKLLGRYMIFAFLILIGVILITRATMFREHWLQPFFLIFPILLFQKLKGNEVDLKKRFKILKYICLAIFFYISIDFSLKSYIRLYTGHPTSVFNIPYKSMADLIEAYAPESDIVFTQEETTAGHLKMILPEKLVLVENDLHHMALESTSILKTSNSIFIWRPEEDQNQVPLDISLFQKAIIQNISVEIIDSKLESINYDLTDDKPYRVGIAKIDVNYYR